MCFQTCAKIGSHLQSAVGQNGGLWLQFWLHHASVTPEPGMPWQVFCGPGGAGGAGPGGAGGPGAGAGGQGPTGSTGSGSGMLPLHRAFPGNTFAHDVCATNSAEAKHEAFCGLNISQKNVEDPAVTHFCAIAVNASVVNGSWSAKSSPTSGSRNGYCQYGEGQRATSIHTATRHTSSMQRW
jgi:hypothetical protein